MRDLFALVVLVCIGMNSVSPAKPRKYEQPLYDRQQRYQPYYQSQGPLEASGEDHQDLSKIPGEAGRDYPLYHIVPETSFSCASVPFVPGIYANVETGCQAYHVCHDGREGHQGASFLCSNGTLFNQKEFTCDWWYKVDCREAPDHYRLNGDEETNPFAPKAKSSEDYRSAEQVSPLPGLKYYKPQRQYTGQADYGYDQQYQQPYKQPYKAPYQQNYQQPYQQPYKPSYQQPYRHKQSAYKEPLQQYEQQEYQSQEQEQEPEQYPPQNQASYEDSQEKNYHPTRFY